MARDDVGRDVVHRAAVNQHPAVQLAPAERCSGSDIVARIACASDPRSSTTWLARDQVDGDAPERRRQLVEARRCRSYGAAMRAEQQLHLLAVVERRAAGRCRA